MGLLSREAGRRRYHGSPYAGGGVVEDTRVSIQETWGYRRYHGSPDYGSGDTVKRGEGGYGSCHGYLHMGRGL